MYFISIYCNKANNILSILKPQLYRNALCIKDWRGSLTMAVDCRNVWEWIKAIYSRTRL